MFSAFIGIILANMLFLALHLESRTMPKPLTLKEEKEEFEKFHNGDRSARDRLIKHNLRLVAHIIKKYYTKESDHEDLVSIGTIGLIKALDSFNPDKSIKLSSYASRCIENEILMHFRNGKKSAQDMSLDDSIDTDKDGNPLTLIDILAVDDDFTRNLERETYLSKLRKFIDETLDEREKKIIDMRFGLDGSKPKTQQEIADILGISRSYISRIEKKSLDLLRKRYEKEDL